MTYRLHISFIWNLGISVWYEPWDRGLRIFLPFVGILIGLSKYAKGIYLFGCIFGIKVTPHPLPFNRRKEGCFLFSKER